MKQTNGHRADRVRANTAPEINERIDRQTDQSLRWYVTQPKDAIQKRIEDLEQEWDIERVLETTASSLSLFGVIMGLAGRKRWLLLSGGVLGFFLTHAIQGWCPPLPVMRKLGVRTQQEIDAEKYALKYLHGDFEHVKSVVEEMRQAIEDFKAAS